MIIEFAGLPGSGKSTVEAFLQDELHQRQQSFLVYKDLEAGYVESNGSFYLSFYLKLWQRCFKRLAYKAFWPKQCAPLYWLLKDLELYKFYRETFQGKTGKQKEIFWPSEFILQHLANLRVWHPHLDFLGELEISMDAVNIIFIDIELEQGFERLWQRGIPSSWPKEACQRERAWECYLAFNEALKSFLKEYQVLGAVITSFSTNGTEADVKEQIPKLANELVVI